MSTPIWIVRDYIACTGCQRCEIACSMHHEGWMWPEASRIRVFMPFPGVEVPHFCAQCDDYPCVEACPVAVICDLCGGDPECVKVCQEAGYNALTLVQERMSDQRKLFAMEPMVVAKDLAVNMFGEKGEEVI
jgi:carbon-monoxide dehydrogenase iron sulfur subunit